MPLIPLNYLTRPVETFHSGEEPQPFVVVPVLAEGRDALIKVREQCFHEWHARIGNHAPTHPLRHTHGPL